MTTITIDRATVEKALAALDAGVPISPGSILHDWFRAALAQQVEPTLTIERLRDALVASRIIPPEAVEDPDEYDDGVTLHRIEALHRRIA